MKEYIESLVLTNGKQYVEDMLKDKLGTKIGDEFVITDKFGVALDRVKIKEEQ